LRVVTDTRILAGLERQAAERRALLDAGARRLGWKAGFGTAAAMAGLRIDAPLSGFMTDRTLLPDGGSMPVAGWGKAVLEPEIAVRLGTDLGPGASREQAAAAIDALAPAIELADLSGPLDDVEAILAGNIFHRAVVLGTFVPVGDGVGLDGLRVDVAGAGGPIAEDVDPTELLGDLADVVRLLADALPAADDRMRAGDVVITGSVIPGIAVSGGERVEVSAAGLGSVSVALG
jgi:2-keto-4-pentenoate hydratase